MDGVVEVRHDASVRRIAAGEPWCLLIEQLRTGRVGGGEDSLLLLLNEVSREVVDAIWKHPGMTFEPKSRDLHQRTDPVVSTSCGDDRTAVGVADENDEPRRPRD